MQGISGNEIGSSVERESVLLLNIKKHFEYFNMLKRAYLLPVK